MFVAGSEEGKAAWQWGYLAGLWHDLGKFAPEWQEYLRKKSGADIHMDEIVGTVDHSTAGAQWADRKIPFFGRVLAFLLAGHHAGLSDGIATSSSSLLARLEKRIPPLPVIPHSIADAASNLNPIPATLRSGHSLAFFARILFSSLVDADFLATEAFMSEEKARFRPVDPPSITDLEATLVVHLATFPPPASEVNRLRVQIRDHCLAAAEELPGMFSLTVPTGGGKTLSSLAFALKHARLHDLRRIIYVIPYTSIIEQNANVFREALAALGPEVVLEHHSNLDPDSEHQSIASRLTAENWDARIIVTTNVQFFESLHGNRSSRCRKLHRLARAVVILDEAQALPIEFLAPCLRTLEELTNTYGTSVVLCTATQPALVRRDEFPIGLTPPREIIPDPSGLHRALRRVVATRSPEKLDDDALGKMLADEAQVLCVVNTRRHARELFELLPDDGSRYHLSALMCAEHRTKCLAAIRCRLERRLPVRLISTQLIEAGVDIDFPVVYRELAGLDSITQAAGRCDREGKLTDAAGKPAGRVVIFESPSLPPAGFIRNTAASAAEILSGNPPDPLAPEAVESYFRIHYWKHADSTDVNHILDCWPDLRRAAHLSPEDAARDTLLGFRFRTCADEFRLIDDSYTESVIIPYGAVGKALWREVRETFDPTRLRHLGRKLQRYTVSVPRTQYQELLTAGILLPAHDDRFFFLNSDIHYSEDFGLHPIPDLSVPAVACMV
jgi:CRISPR-associated endonuclease/helicase Cas3